MVARSGNTKRRTDVMIEFEIGDYDAVKAAIQQVKNAGPYMRSARKKLFLLAKNIRSLKRLRFRSRRNKRPDICRPYRNEFTIKKFTDL